MKLLLPLQYVKVTQYFGENLVDFYKKMGRKGHSGIDFGCSIGTPFFAVFSGVIEQVFTSDEGGLSVKLVSMDKNFMAFYCHLNKVSVKENQKVKAGDVLGETGNSGSMTTGAHLHFGLYPRPSNANNGYGGAIDPYPYLWDLANVPVDNKYGAKRRWIDEWKIRFKNSWLHRQLIAGGREPLGLTDREVNGLVYGYWDWHTINDPAMYSTWIQITKPAYLKGERPRVMMNR